jgi:hypothetical protein
MPEAVVEFADDRVPAGIAGGDIFRGHGGQTVEAGLRAVQIGFSDGAIEGVNRRRCDTIEQLEK